LYDSKDGLTLEEILQRYNSKMILKVRIDRLIDNEQIILKNGKYYTGRPTVLLFAKMIVKMKLLLFGKDYESIVI